MSCTSVLHERVCPTLSRRLLAPYSSLRQRCKTLACQPWLHPPPWTKNNQQRPTGERHHRAVKNRRLFHRRANLSFKRGAGRSSGTHVPRDSPSLNAGRGQPQTDPVPDRQPQAKLSKPLHSIMTMQVYESSHDAPSLSACLGLTGTEPH